jgi:hypothetical protein
MFRHRLAPDADYYRLPEPPAATVRPTGFALCSIAILPACNISQWLGVQQLYLVAFEQALETARPALPDRGLFTFWN